jgi:primosomal protein DnaI
VKSAQAQIRQMMKGRPIKSLDERIKEMMGKKPIDEFRNEHPDIPLEAYKRALPQLAQYVREKNNCAQCTGLEGCKNLFAGHHSILVGYETNIDLKMKKCSRLEAKEKMEKQRQLMKSHRIQKNVLCATFETIDLDNQRVDVISEAIEYCESFADGVPRRGLYLYGSFGVGKSHIASAMANHLADFGVDVFMVYVPDYFQAIYDTFNDKNANYNELIDSAKQATVLILDDIGAENLNPWVRDQVMGPILQYRMAEELPTIFTSNLTINELEDHFANTTKGGTEKIKALRIMERIRHCAKPLHVKGKNRRLEWTT